MTCCSILPDRLRVNSVRGRHSGVIDCAAITGVDVKLASIRLTVKGKGAPQQESGKRAVHSRPAFIESQEVNGVALITCSSCWRKRRLLIPGLANQTHRLFGVSELVSGLV